MIFKNLCLGTAQFGLNYGISNVKGKLNTSEVKKVLSYAKKNGINWLDTAQNYGNAEELIGQNIKKNNKFKLITKINSFGVDKFDDEVIDNYEYNLQNSLKNLSIEKLDVVLIHNYKDLKRKNNNLFNNWLTSLKERNLVDKIGISIYELSDLENISLDKIEIIQLPISLLDQRILESNIIKNSVKKGKIIHARSIFLQGLVFQETNKLPNIFTKEFIVHHQNFRKHFSFNNKEIIKVTFSFLKKINFVETVIVGINDLNNLKEICKFWNENDLKDIKLSDYKKYSWDNYDDIDPRKWVKLN